MTVFVVSKELINADAGGELVSSTIDKIFSSKALADNYVYLQNPKRVMGGYLEERYKVQAFSVFEDL